MGAWPDGKWLLTTDDWLQQDRWLMYFKGTVSERALFELEQELRASGEAEESSRLSKTDISSGRRGGIRSHRKGPRGRTRDQLYEEAKDRGIRGRSKMTKAELQRALGGRR